MISILPPPPPEPIDYRAVSKSKLGAIQFATATLVRAAELRRAAAICAECGEPMSAHGYHSGDGSGCPGRAT